MYLNFDILFSTAGSVCGREITQHMGILAERKVVSADIGAEKMAAAMDTQYAALAAAMNERAKDIGADAVVGVDFRLDSVGDKLVFSMTGNAVRLRDSAAVPESLPAGEEIAEFDAEIEELDAEEAEIAELDAEIEALDAEEAEIEEVFVFEEAKPQEEAAAWQCSCGTKNDIQYRYCPQCGEKRGSGWLCPGCGKENLPEYKFCPGCGSLRG